MYEPTDPSQIQYHTLVGGLDYGFYFSHSVGNVIIPTDELTPSFFQRG